MAQIPPVLEHSDDRSDEALPVVCDGVQSPVLDMNDSVPGRCNLGIYILYFVLIILYLCKYFEYVNLNILILSLLKINIIYHFTRNIKAFYQDWFGIFIVKYTNYNT